MNAERVAQLLRQGIDQQGRLPQGEAEDLVAALQDQELVAEVMYRWPDLIHWSTVLFPSVVQRPQPVIALAAPVVRPVARPVAPPLQADPFVVIGGLVNTLGGLVNNFWGNFRR